MKDNVYKISRQILYKELQPLFEALSVLRYAVVKGEVLSNQIYGVPDRRRSGDIDILIDKKNIKYLEELLHKAGFLQILPDDSVEVRRNRVFCLSYSHQIPSYYKDKLGFCLNVDVNYDIFWGEYDGDRCSIDDFLSDTIDMEIFGVKVKTLPKEKAFVHLVLHHYKEMNSLYHLSQHNPIRTDMFRDIYDMLVNNGDVLSREALMSLSEQYSIGKYMYYILYYTSQVFKCNDISQYVCALKRYEDIVLLNSYGLSLNEQKKWGISFCERLDNKNNSDYVKNSLNSVDIRKIEMNSQIFK